MFADLDRELNFGYQKNGSLVVAYTEAETKVLQELLQRGVTNGVKNLQIVNQTTLRSMEPHIHPDAIAALYAPDAGNVIPYEFAIALAESAVDNGVELRIRRCVTAIEPISDNGGFNISVRHWEPSDYVHRPSHTIAFGLGGVVLAMSATVASFGLVLGLASIYAMVFACGVYTKRISLPPLTGPVSNDFKKLVKQAGTPVGVGSELLVNVDDMLVGGSGSLRVQKGVTVANETVRANFVVNCAGGASDVVSRMIGDCLFKIKPRIGRKFFCFVLPFNVLYMYSLCVTNCLFSFCYAQRLHHVKQKARPPCQTYALPVPRPRVG
jgi:hypothetical protein